MTDHSGAVARVRNFLDVCGTPREPIARVWRYDAEGHRIPFSSVGLFAADVRALLDAVQTADELLGLHGEQP